MTNRPFGKVIHDDSALEAKRRKRALRSFVRDWGSEELLEVRAKDPERFAQLRLAPRQILALDYYAASRAAAQAAARAQEDDAA
jgi:hypothetical protein